MKAVLVEQPAMTLAGYVVRTRGGSKVAALWTQMRAALAALPGPEAGVTYGASANPDCHSCKFDYLAGVRVAGPAAAPPETEVWELPAGSYLVVETTVAARDADYDEFYCRWLPASQYEPLDAPTLERYEAGFDPADPEARFTFHTRVRVRQPTPVAA